MARMPGVKFVGPSPNITINGLNPSRVRGVVVHIAEGYFQGTQAWQKNPDANTSSHFIVDKDGTNVQMVDTKDAAWTQRDGNPEWLSIEFIGFAGQSLTREQIQTGAEILLWVHRTFPNVPLQVATAPSGRGLGHHSMGAENGVNWGHSECPGQPIKAQKAGIVALAITMKNGGTEVIEDEDVALTPAQDGALSVAWKGTAALLSGNPIEAATGGDNQPAARRVWVVDILNDILRHLQSLVQRPSGVALTPADHEAIGRATARALLEMVSEGSASAFGSMQAPDGIPATAPRESGWFETPAQK